MTTTQEIARAVADGPQAFADWVSANINLITADLASDLRNEALRAIEHGDGMGAVSRQMGAAQVLRLVGEERESLLAAGEAHQTLYMMANTPTEYDNVRDDILYTERESRELGFVDVAFDMAVVAADCCFWASEATSDAGDQTKRLLDCVEDLLRAADGATDISDIYLMRYSSVAIAAFIQVLQLEPPPSDAVLDPLLKSLARDTERLVPVEFTIADDATKTRYTAEHLAHLSNEYGNPQIGSERRAFALRDSRGN